jgi:hypothetical protein
MAKITVALMRDLEQQVSDGNISYSRMVEILNEQTKHKFENRLCFYKIKDKMKSLQGLSDWAVFAAKAMRDGLISTSDNTVKEEEIININCNNK